MLTFSGLYILAFLEFLNTSVQFHGSGVRGIPSAGASVRSPRVSPGDPTLSGGRGTLRNLAGPVRQPRHGYRGRCLGVVGRRGWKDA